MVTPASESPDNSHALSRERHVVMMYRNNLLFRRLLPEIELQLRRECNISLERVNFPELTTPPQMTETLEAVFDKSRSDTLYITDVTVRRGIRAMRDLGEPLIDAAHHGVLLDQCLATAVKQIVADELRRPILQRMVATPSAKERAATGELNLRAEKVFFEALLLPLVRAYPNHQFVVVAEKLLHHAPFVTYFGALREAYSAQFGNSDPVIIPELLAWEHKGSMLSLPRVPPEVISRLSAVTGGDIQHPCDWIKDILIGAGCLSEQVIVVDTSEHLANFVLAGDRHLQVILGDRHVLDQEKLFRALQNVGRSDEEAYARAARCLAGPTFRLPLENLITDLAASGVLCAQGTTLLSPESIRIRLAEAVVKEVKKLIMLKDT